VWSTVRHSLQIALPMQARVAERSPAGEAEAGSAGERPAEEDLAANHSDEWRGRPCVCLGRDSEIQNIGRDFPIPGKTHAGRQLRSSMFARYLLALKLHWIAQNLLLLSKRSHDIIPVGNLKVSPSMKEKPDVLQGTLALMVLKTLDVLGPQHGYGIARRIEQISGDVLAVNQGTLYPLLLKLENEGSIASQWGASENNRRARFYRLTTTGRKQLRAETRDWKQTAAVIARFFKVKAEDLP